MKKNNILSNAKGHWILIVFILFGILFLVKNMFFNRNLNDEIIVLEHPKTHELTLSSKALVIKDEYLYYLGKSNIEVDSLKVNVDKEIGEVDVSSIDSNLKDYLSQKVEILEKQVEGKDTKNENIDLENILKYLRNKDFSKTFDILSSEQSKIAFGKKYSSDKLFRYSLLNDTINSGKVVAKNSGVVLKKIDGLENVYDFSVIDSIDEKDFNFDSSNNISNIDGIKIVDNLKYYLCIRLKKDAIEDIDIGSSIKVNIGDSTAIGVIKNIKSGSEYDLIVAQFSSAFSEVADKRFIDLNVIKFVSTSFELPSSALVSKDGEDYVLTVDSFNNIKRVKVNVKFIDKINSKVYIDSVNSSVGIFSNILKDAGKIKEGAILK